MADQTLKQEQQQAQELAVRAASEEQPEINAEMLDIEKLEVYLQHANPNSEEYLVLMELLAQERAKNPGYQMTSDEQ